METDTHYLHGEPCIFGDWIDTRNPDHCVKQVTGVDYLGRIVLFSANGKDHRMVAEEAILLRRACETKDHDRARFDYCVSRDSDDPPCGGNWVNTGHVIEGVHIWYCWRREKTAHVDDPVADAREQLRRIEVKMAELIRSNRQLDACVLNASAVTISRLLRELEACRKGGRTPPTSDMDIH